MHFDIVEVLRQKERQRVRNVAVDNGDEVDISFGEDGTLVIRRHEPDPIVPPS